MSRPDRPRLSPAVLAALGLSACFDPGEIPIVGRLFGDDEAAEATGQCLTPVAPVPVPPPPAPPPPDPTEIQVGPCLQPPPDDRWRREEAERRAEEEQRRRAGDELERAREAEREAARRAREEVRREKEEAERREAERRALEAERQRQEEEAAAERQQMEPCLAMVLPGTAPGLHEELHDAAPANPRDDLARELANGGVLPVDVVARLTR